ncbi:inner membrane YaaH domain protein [Serratia plymuthica A30]|nr:inner membrane YaaH domain protein [Serratia plymuthica A30]
MLFNCPLSQSFPRSATAVANKMGPSHSASRGKVKKISFLSSLRSLFPAQGIIMMPRALMEVTVFSAIQTIYEFT